jgi:hypothetical protein
MKDYNDALRIFSIPLTDEERKRHAHALTFAMIAADVTATQEERENAIRHMLVCDPARGIGALIELITLADATTTLYRDLHALLASLDPLGE